MWYGVQNMSKYDIDIKVQPHMYFIACAANIQLKKRLFGLGPRDTLVTTFMLGLNQSLNLNIRAKGQTVYGKSGNQKYKQQVEVSYVYGEH